ncbi:MAG: GNAT family N-acetyltransferase [Planctomicrobium sp.]|nr:GNAT family N-acetyltransferase [Planctomicrobium sp.]
MPVRIEVFVDEQKVPIELEQDDRDTFCLHVLAIIDDQPIGTGRIDIEKGGKIGRIAVLSEFRERGVGKVIMSQLETIAQDHQLSELFLNSQVAAIEFYKKQGFIPTGDVFVEADIDHVKMVKTFKKS